MDSDVAALYGVETREINQAVRNNPEKFPPNYVIELNKEEKLEVIKFFDNLSNLKFSPSLPKAFTEKGLYMLATILKSPQATQTTIAIIETFAMSANSNVNYALCMKRRTLRDSSQKCNTLERCFQIL